MKVVIFTFLIVLTFSLICLADMAPEGDTGWSAVPKSILNESFEGNFPPNDWEIQSSHPNQAWKKVDSAFDDKMIPNSGETFGKHFALSTGNDNEFYYELLITPELELTHARDEEILEAGLYFSYNISDIADEKYDFQILYHFTDDSSDDPWQLVWSLKRDGPSSSSFFWHTSSIDIEKYINEGSFRIGFLFTGESDIGIGLDVVDGNYKLISPKDEDRNNGCGCNVSGDGTAIPLALGIFLIGFCAWISWVPKIQSGL